MEVLSDGEWHDVEELVEAAVGLVPPGKAHRSWEKHLNDEERRRRARKGGTPVQRKNAGLSPRSGARRMLLGNLRSRVRYGSLERDGQRYRLAVRDG